MKAGILTLHYGYNEGAVLQAYCLAQMLRSTTGKEAEIIDLRYPSKVEVYGPPTDPRKEAIADAANHWLPCSEASWRAIPDPDFYEALNRDYDLVVVGSDVVWSLKYTRALRSIFPGGLFARQKEPFHPKFPNAYWLPHRLNIPKYSYAASIGSFDWNTAPASHQSKMRSLVQDFAAISIRDEKTQSFLRHLDPALADRAHLVPDPTLCVDLDVIEPDRQSVWDQMAAWGLDFNRKKLGMLMGAKETYRPLVEHFVKQDWDTASLTTANAFSENRFFSKPLSPPMWARALGAFDFILTERMHGMIFCLKNQVPFLALDINPNTPEKPSKVVSLLKKFDLLDCCCDANADPETMMSALRKALEHPWDWQSIQKKLDQLKSQGHAFLKNNLV